MTKVVSKLRGIWAGSDWRYGWPFILLTGKASLPVLLFIYKISCAFCWWNFNLQIAALITPIGGLNSDHIINKKN